MAKTAEEYTKGITANIVAGMMPGLQQQKKGMYDYIRQLTRRTGQVGGQDLATGVAPYAQAAGDVAARAAGEATRLGQQKQQFDVQQEAWEKSFAESQKQNRLNQMISQFNTTGVWTPEMIQAFGYDIDKSQQRGVQSQLDILGINTGGGGGGSFADRARQKSPAWQRLYGGGGGGGGGGGASYNSLSTPSQPFRRVTGAGQGPGLMALR